jgi:hypothetical protein
LFLHGQYRGVERPQDFILERVRGPVIPINANTSPAVMPKNQCNWNRVFFNTSDGLAELDMIFTARIMPWVVEKLSFCRRKPRAANARGFCMKRLAP